MHKLLPSIALLAALPATAQSPCAQLFVEQLRYDAFNPAAIELVVNNQSTELFSYPSFVLVDDLGDTLAREQVNFFGIGGEQAHHLVADPGVTLPNGTFDATLLLYTGFGDSLFCTWDLQDISLCPPDSCVQAEIYLTNTGTLLPFNAYYWIHAVSDGSIAANGYVVMDDVTHTHFDTVCLPPGEYEMVFSAFSPIDTDYVAGITTSYLYSLGTNVALQQDPTPLDLSFTWYGECVAGTNGLQEIGARPLQVSATDGLLTVTDPTGNALGQVSLWGSDGRLIAARSARGSSAELSTAGLATGIVLVRVQGPDGAIANERIMIP